MTRIYHGPTLALDTRPPLPIKTYTTLVPTFAKKGNFSKVGGKSRKMDKSAKFWKSVNILHVSACFHSGFHTVDLERVFKYSFQIRRNEKYDVHGKNVKNTINLAFTKRVLYLI